MNDLNDEAPIVDGAVPQFLKRSMFTWKVGLGVVVVLLVACIPFFHFSPPNVQQAAAAQFGGLGDLSSAQLSGLPPEAPDPSPSPLSTQTPFPVSTHSAGYPGNQVVAAGYAPSGGGAAQGSVSTPAPTPVPLPPSDTYLDFSSSAPPSGSIGAVARDAVVADNAAPGYVDAEEYQLNAGTYIPIRAVARVDSTLPGCLSMQVTKRVNASGHPDVVLVPAGATVIACYSSQGGGDQARLEMTASRLTFPDGSPYNMGPQPVVGVAGEQGANGHVDTHAGRAVGQALMYSVIGGLTSAIGGKNNSVINVSGGGIADAAYSNAQRQRPTFHIEAGQPFALFLKTDLPMRPYNENAATK